MRCLMGSGSVLPYFFLSHQSLLLFFYLFFLNSSFCLDTQSPISMGFFSFLPSARPSSLLLWGAHDQELPRHGPRGPAQRAPRGRTHCRSVPGCHVHASTTGHSHSHQQPTAGSAHPQRLKWSLSVPANFRLSDQCSIFKKIQKLLILL